MICVKQRSLNVQVHVSKTMLSSSNSVMKYRIVTSQGGIHREEG